MCDARGMFQSTLVGMFHSAVMEDGQVCDGGQWHTLRWCGVAHYASHIALKRIRIRLKFNDVTLLLLSSRRINIIMVDLSRCSNLGATLKAGPH